MKAKDILVATLFAGTALAAPAQTALQPVTTARMQQWIDAKFSYAGVDAGSGCAFLNSGTKQGRVVFFNCPNGDTMKLEGTARVNGSLYCNDFPAPVGKECFAWKAGKDGRFEQVKDGRATASGFILGSVPLN